MCHTLRRLILFTALFLAAGGLFAPAQQQELIGAGATFPEPLYAKMFDVYLNQSGVRINYQGIGSGGGIQQLLQKTVDFAGFDAYVKDAQMASFGGSVLHVPTCLGAVVVTYNLPGSPFLNLTPDVIADIFLGRIKTWNDGRITALYEPKARDLRQILAAVRILCILGERKGRVYTRETLLDRLWGRDKIVMDRTVDVHVKNLREKLGDAGSFIRCIRGVGYKIEE